MTHCVIIAVADLPGLIEGAAQRNAGLGAQFLSLIEGCYLLVYLVDVGSFLSSTPQGHSELTAHITNQLAMLHEELRLFNPDLVSRARCLVVGTKMDLVAATADDDDTSNRVAASLAAAAKDAGLMGAETLLISSRRGDNIEKLTQMIGQLEVPV